MCAIIRLLPNQRIDKEKLYTAVYNNWHSYGLVTKVGTDMDVKRVVPESGEINPDDIWKLLEDNLKLERILHVRHNTAGVTDLTNCHPFDVFYKPKTKRKVVFMHNGTMSEYKSKKIENGVANDDNSGPSDTKNYVDQILIPIVSQYDGMISDPMFRRIIEKFWPFGNRGVLICNDQPSLFLGDWKELNNDNDPIKVSNLDYFDRISRGPEHSRRLAAEMKGRKEVGEEKASKFVLLSSLKDYNQEEVHGFYKLSESAVNIMNDWEIYSRESGISVAGFTREELEQIRNDKSTCIDLMDWIFGDYAKLYKEYIELEEKHDRATKKIAGMVEELRAANSKKRVG